MTELVLVEGVTDVQLISYYLQNVYGWKHEKDNYLRMVPIEKGESIENLSKLDSRIVLCGVGGNGKFNHFIQEHRISEMLIETAITSIVLVTDRDNDSVLKIQRRVNMLFTNGVTFSDGKWIENTIKDSFNTDKKMDSFLMIIPNNQKGALERVVIQAIKENSAEKLLMDDVEQFVESLKNGNAPDLIQENKACKAIVGTYFSVRYPKNAMRSFGLCISHIDWSKSPSVKELFLPFSYLGEDKPY